VARRLLQMTSRHTKQVGCGPPTRRFVTPVPPAQVTPRISPSDGGSVALRLLHPPRRTLSAPGGKSSWSLNSRPPRHRRESFLLHHHSLPVLLVKQCARRLLQTPTMNIPTRLLLFPVAWGLNTGAVLASAWCSHRPQT